jgi:SpoIIAA-like
MIEFLPRSHRHVVGIKIGGKLTATDYEQILIPKLNDLLAQYRAINVLFVMDETFSGWTLDAAWDDAAYALKHRANFGRIAVVGGPAWVRWCMAASAFLMVGEMRAFPAEQLEAAWRWVDVATGSAT